MVRKTRKIRQGPSPSGEGGGYEVGEEEIPPPRPGTPPPTVAKSMVPPRAAREGAPPEGGKRSVEQSLSLQEMVMAEIEADLVRKEQEVRSQLQTLNGTDPTRVDELLSTVSKADD